MSVCFELNAATVEYAQACGAERVVVEAVAARQVSATTQTPRKHLASRQAPHAGTTAVPLFSAAERQPATLNRLGLQIRLNPLCRLPSTVDSEEAFYAPRNSSINIYAYYGLGCSDDNCMLRAVLVKAGYVYI